VEVAVPWNGNLPNIRSRFPNAACKRLRASQISNRRDYLRSNTEFNRRSGQNVVPIHRIAGDPSIQPWWRNLFDNTLTVQFEHQMMAYTQLNLFVARG
jgi:heme A synthase